jgi:antitoxin VapB
VSGADPAGPVGTKIILTPFSHAAPASAPRPTLGRPPGRLRIFAAGLCSGICLEGAGDGTARQTVSQRAKPGRQDPTRVRIPGTDAIMRKEGDRLTLEPAPKHSIDRLLAVLATLEDLPEDEQLPEIEDLPPEPFDL